MNEYLQNLVEKLRPVLAGKTIGDVSYREVEGEYGNEPVVVLHFTDETEHAFVLPSEGWL